MSDNSQVHSGNIDAVHNAHDDATSPRCAWGNNMFRSKEDAASFGRWRLGFFVFYGVTAMALAGLAVATERTTMVASVAKSANPAMASADIKHR